jgi:hypothetical protein
MFYSKIAAHAADLAEHTIDESAAIEHGMKEKAAEFQHSGAEIYSKP